MHLGSQATYSGDLPADSLPHSACLATEAEVALPDDLEMLGQRGSVELVVFEVLVGKFLKNILVRKLKQTQGRRNTYGSRETTEIVILVHHVLAFFIDKGVSTDVRGTRRMISSSVKWMAVGEAVNDPLVRSSFKGFCVGAS